MAVELLTPFSLVLRRTVLKGTADVLTGRWVQVDGNGFTLAPASPGAPLYLALEGNLVHTGGVADFDGSGNSTKSTALPSVGAVGAIGVAYGIYRYHVGPEGVLQSDALTVGAKVYADSAGRLTINASGTFGPVAIIEALTGTTAAWTDVVVRTLSV